jgi:hypothetical protein
VPSVKVELTDREMDAATEFARQCGESVPDLMRKLMIRDATLADGFGADDPSYNFSVILPIDGNGKNDREQIENGYNQIRKMLGWREIHL